MVRGQRTDLDLSYPAVPQSVGQGRRALVTFAQDAGAGEEQVEAVSLAASEALTNVVKHAYQRPPGRIHLTAAVAYGELCVLVADEGCGFRPHTGGGGLGLGLRLIATLCDELAILTREGGGTELRLWFRLDPTRPPPAHHSRGSVASATAPA